jgi:DMSO/TMAO reductase YedYZ molybdopterin-dependent catalytic subunit
MKRTSMWAGLVAVVLAVAVVVAGAAMPAATPQAAAVTPGAAADAVVLTVTGNGQTRTFTMAQLKALPVYEGYAGFVNSAGTVTPPWPLKGVTATDLLKEVGGIPDGQSIDVTASDDYGMTFTWDECVNGAITVYNASTKQEETPAAPVSMVLAYEENGAPITASPSGEGPLRLVFAQATDVNQIADGHLFVKWVDRIGLRNAVVPWEVKMYGLKDKKGNRQTYTLDRATFDSCATPGCHGASWVEPVSQKTWSGVPLFLCIGKVDGGKGHGGYGAYNEALALKGYRIKVTSAIGGSAIIGSRTIRNVETIILANKQMGSDLGPEYYPLRLMGPKIGSKNWVGQITKIQLLPK